MYKKNIIIIISNMKTFHEIFNTLAGISNYKFTVIAIVVVTWILNN